MKPLRIINVVGARPNFMKIAPIIDEMRKHAAIQPYLLHTGQHYDHAMSDLFFNHLGLPKPDAYLGVGSGGHGEQTGKVMIEAERYFRDVQPHLVLVVGDVNSTIACGLVAVKMGVKLAHVEAGLRSFDRTMPEEINRILTDQISDYLFITEPSAGTNLRREGIAGDKIYFAGNVMIDSLMKHREKARESQILQTLGLQPGGFVLVTLHRPSNVDDRATISGLMHSLRAIAVKVPVLFPVHPRTRKQLHTFGLADAQNGNNNLHLVEPLGYLDFLHCMANAKLVITDSGGIQEETTVLQIPCLTVRENTERPVTVEIGTNTIIGTDPQRLLQEAGHVLSGTGKAGRLPELWDGRAAERIVQVLLQNEGVVKGSGIAVT